jgi:putative ABC transport system permease protein
MTSPLFLKLALRDLRGGIRNFRIFLACLALGVAAIAAIGSISSSVVVGMAADGRILLGGDIDIRLTHRPITEAQLRWLSTRAEISEITAMRSMAHRLDGTRRSLINFKTVDGRYPLFGKIVTTPPEPLADLLAFREGAWGAVVGPSVLTRLGLKRGDTIRVGAARFQIRAVIKSEPDSIGGARSLTRGPRFITAKAALAETALVMPGAQIHYRYRVKLVPGDDPESFRGALAAAFPDAPWRVRDHTNAAPGAQRFIDRTTQFLALVGMTALLIGGVGAGNAVRSYLAGKTEVIATLKCLGASRRLIFATWLTQIAIMTAAAIAAGLVIGAILPLIIGELLSELIPTPLRTGLHPVPLGLAAMFGFLVAAIFSLPPLSTACNVPPGSLFRGLVQPVRARLDKITLLGLTVGVAMLGSLAVATAYDKGIALWFIGAAIAAFVLFYSAGRGLMRAASIIGRATKGYGSTSLRFALANLHRPGAETAGIVLSMGLGLTVLIAVVVVEGNLSRQITSSIPAKAPDYYFIDIQPDQVAGFEQIVKGAGRSTLIDRVPILRGRITRVNGTPSSEIKVDGNVAWMLRNDRGLTWSASPPDGVRITAGEWWPANYNGPPLISLGEEAARGFGIGLGDTLTLNVLGRPITARIANLRAIDWRSLRINFVIVFSPGVIEAAPQTHIATVRVNEADEEAVEAAVTNRYANITAVRVRDVLKTVAELMDRIAGAVRITAGITLLSGTLVLAGAVVASHRRRAYDTVVLKVLGARRREILAILFCEFAIMATATAGLAAMLGSAAGWAILTRVMHMEWTPLIPDVAATATAATVFIVSVALAGTWRSLGQKAAPLLRND